MFLFDNRITLENRDVLEEYLNGFDYKTSGLSYSALYMWRDINPPMANGASKKKSNRNAEMKFISAFLILNLYYNEF